jgi:hypothetical protein
MTEGWKYVLTIRAVQMRILQAGKAVEFVNAVAEHLARRFQDRPIAADPDRLREFVREGIQLAQGYKIVDQYDLRRFLEFRAEYGPDCHNIPWVARILSDPYLSGCGKMEQLDGYSLFVARP